MFGHYILWVLIVIYSEIAVFIGIPAAIWAYCSYEFHAARRRLKGFEVDAIIHELIARHGDRAEDVAYTNEDRAWRYSDTREQGKWRRVRDELRRRSAQGGG